MLLSALVPAFPLDQHCAISRITQSPSASTSCSTAQDALGLLSEVSVGLNASLDFSYCTGDVFKSATASLIGLESGEATSTSIMAKNKRPKALVAWLNAIEPNYDSAQLPLKVIGGCFDIRLLVAACQTM